MRSSPVMALRQVGAEQANYWMTLPISSSTRMDTPFSSKAKGGDTSASVDDASVKVRKPYTITKQRERWTEDEHQKFLEALKLYGRAWRRIEEHIGTKTAVQIRSHAQKFFSKLEREASLGGSLTTAGSGEIDIPPPRPKRKPSHPYPKKALGALSNSLSLDEGRKSPPAVCSAFTPLDHCSGTTNSDLPKKAGYSTASLRLFGQTVVQGIEKIEADNDRMESAGSPMSQISVVTEETTAISPIASNTSVAWDQSALLSKLNESATAETNFQFYYGSTEWEKNLLALHVLVGGHHLPSYIPAFWQGFVPPCFNHDTNDDSNAAAAIAATAYAVTSAWQAIYGALISDASNETINSTLYSPIAVLAEAGQPIPLSVPNSLSHEKMLQGSSHHDRGSESKGTNLQQEDSTAECCSSLTDSSKLSSYESNDDRVPVKKRQRKHSNDVMPLHNGSPEATHARSSKDENKKTGQSLPDEVMQPVDDNLQTRAISKDGEQPIDLETLANCSSLPSVFDENFSEARGSKQNGKKVVPSLSASESEENKSCTSKESVEGSLSRNIKKVDGAQSKCDEHLFMINKSQASLKSRYSGTGFIPYRNFTSG